MVRWIFVGTLFALCLVRYIYAVQTQVQVNIGDQVAVTGVIWNGKIRLENRSFVILDKLVDLSDGDEVTVVGRITDQVTEKYGISIYLEEAQIRNNHTPIFFRLRVFLEQKIINYLPGDAGGLASGILLGGNKLLAYNTKRDFTRDGLSHIIAASGYNVVMVSGWLARIGKKLKHQRLMILLGVLGTILYMLLAGLTASVIRAGIMSIISFTALVYGRKSDAIWSLIMTAVIMILWNPWYIADIGFQLSFAATAGVLASTSSSNPPPKLGGGRKGVVLNELSLIMMVQLFTIPLILHHFGQLSLVAPVANLLVVWTVPFIMQLTALGLIFGPILYLAWPLIAYMLYVSSWLSRLSWASLTVGQMSWGWVAIWYLVLAIVYNRYYAKRSITPDYR
ncbi:MAG: ComEC/Rec2 family competence protein [Candidatus Amesbacteria bacterium]|nr:ComEC/Rec2 family competence protein [Candidatus Amesbacteria bacterium]